MTPGKQINRIFLSDQASSNLFYSFISLFGWLIVALNKEYKHLIYVMLHIESNTAQNIQEYGFSMQTVFSQMPVKDCLQYENQITVITK